MTLMQAADISNYSGPVSPQQARDLYVLGIRRVVVQLVNPRILMHREQIPALLAAGLEVEGYVYVWFSADVAFTAARVAWACAEMDVYPGATKVMWLDCEQADTNDPPFDYVRLPVTPHIRACVQAVRDGGYSPGIYTAPWWWVPGASNSTEWSALPLWHAQYDGDPAIQPVNYGGWTTPAMKQHTPDMTVAGIAQLDLDSYEEFVYPPPPPPQPAPDIPAALAALTAAHEQIHAALAALGARG